MNWKRACYTAVALLVASNLLWAYYVVDSGVTATYQAVSYQEALRDLGVMKRLLPEASPLTRADLLALLRRTNPDAFIVDDSTGVHMSGLLFEFDGNTLVRVGEWGVPPQR